MKFSTIIKTLTKTTIMAAAITAMATEVHAQGRRGGGGGGRGPRGPGPSRPAPYPGPQYGQGQMKVISYGGQVYQGQNTLFIKRALKQQFPGLDLQNKELKSVTLMAKSRMGRGQAALSVGPYSTSYSQTVAGSPYNFQSPAPYTYSRITFQHQGPSQGKWQINLQGNIKVQNVIVQFKGQQKTIKLYVGQHLRGQNQLPLKRMLKQQNPYAQINFANLKKVVLVAKSKMGQGSATLQTGQQFSRTKTVDGSPYDFQNPAPWTFSKTKFQGPAYGFQGPLKLHLRGNIKVQEVILKFH